MTYDLLTVKVHGVRDMCDAGYLCVNFGLPIRLSVLDLGPMYATNRRQTDRRQTSDKSIA